MLNILIITLLLTGCSFVMDLKQNEQQSFVNVFCKKQCKTIVTNHINLSRLEKNIIKRYLPYFDNKKSILVAACDKSDKSKKLAISVVNYIKSNKRKADIVRQVTPYVKVIKNKPCVSLIRGALEFQLFDCDFVGGYDRKLLVGHNFGCSSHYNLLKMLQNPNDILAVADNFE